MKNFTRGQKGRISDLGCTEAFSVVLNLSAQGVDVDATCFGLDANGQLSDDRYMIFFNQKSCPNGGIILDNNNNNNNSDNNNSSIFYINLFKIPEFITRLVFAISINDEGAMEQLGVSTLRLGDAVFSFSGADFNYEKAVIVSEIYKYDNQWRFGAVGQGFDGGLSKLLEYFGGSENPEAPEISKAPENLQTPPIDLQLIKKLTDLADRIKKQKNNVKTEEAVKTAFILPFIQILGYDIFDPAEVIPEHTADHGVKKGEKVDYAIKLDKKITILIECKKVNAPLESKYAGQLFRYFSVTDARFGVLTDGIRYLFYSDLDSKNRMDAKHFFEFNLLDFNKVDVDELKKFSKADFNTDSIINIASNIKYLRALSNEIRIEFSKQSEDLIRVLANRAPLGIQFTDQTKEKYKKLAYEALDGFIKKTAQSK